MERALERMTRIVQKDILLRKHGKRSLGGNTLIKRARVGSLKW